MKYEKCLTCPELGKTCDGPNFLAMDTAEMGEWCKIKLQNQRPDITYDRVAAETGVSKSSVYGFLNGTHTDYRLDTIRPILKLIIGGEWDNNPCGSLNNSEKAKYEETIRHLEREVTHRDKTISRCETEIADLKELVRNTNSRHTNSQEFMREQIRGKNRTIIVLSVVLGAFLLMAIGQMIVDKADPSRGFIWLKNLSSLLTGEANIFTQIKKGWYT